MSLTNCAWCTEEILDTDVASCDNCGVDGICEDCFSDHCCDDFDEVKEID